MAIVQQSQTESTSQLNNVITFSVTLGAGANRLLLVAIPMDSFANADAGIPISVTYAGIPLSLVTDGVDVAQSVQQPSTFPAGTCIGAFWYVLREAQMPAPGANNVVVTCVNGGGAKRFIIGAWVLENCLQSANVRSVANAKTDTPAGLTTLTATLAAGATSDACLVVGCNDTSAGTIQITIGGVGLTEDFDIDQGGSSRGAAGTDLTAPTVGPVACSMTYTLAGTQRAAMSAIRLEEFSIPSGSVELRDEPAGSVLFRAA